MILHQKTGEAAEVTRDETALGALYRTLAVCLRHAAAPSNSASRRAYWQKRAAGLKHAIADRKRREGLT